MNEQSKAAAQRRVELKRRRRELIAVAAAGAGLAAFALAQTALPPLSRHTSLVSNLAVILLFNLSFLLLGLLLFLVGRNIAKVFIERRRGLVGSKLQVRLVIGFVAVAMLPSVFLLYVSESFLRSSIETWFNPQYEQVLNDSLQIAKTYYLNSANDARHYARTLGQQISARGLLRPVRRAELRKLVAARQQEYNLGTIEVFGADRSLLVLALSPQTPTGIGVAPESALLASTLSGHSVTRTDRLGKADVIRGSAPIYAEPDSDAVSGAIVVDYYLPRSIAARAAEVSHSFEDYLQLRMFKQPVFRSYIIALVLIGLVVVLLASWFGVALARGITGPIKQLAEGTHAVAGGNLDYRIAPVGDDEISHLVQSFNQMTADLRASAAELERRRRYTETLLRNVSAGVVALDREGGLTTINPSAERLLGIAAQTAVGRHYREAFQPALSRALDEMLGGGPHHGDLRSSATIESLGAPIELMVTASPLGKERAGLLGTVLFFEDVSQIAKVERMEAWREVARRIAHEIKNPLTPIQLSAERLRRQFLAQPGDGCALVDECTRTIIGEVEDLKHLVDEFSAFARMPHVNPVPGDLNALAEEAVGNFRELNPGIEFALALDPVLPETAFDREAIKRVLVNLLDNAVSAVLGAERNGVKLCIEVRTAAHRPHGIVTLEVSDNGAGIEPSIKARIFEPYFSTKKGGTGLGLAIVSNIVTDHQGFVRVRDNKPRGSRFIVEFPIKEQRLAARFLG